MFVIGTLWIVWLVIWIAAARVSKQTQRREALGSRFVHSAAMLIGGVVLGVPNILGRLFELSFHSRSAVWFAGCTVLVGLGLGFAVLARIWIGGNWSSAVTVKQDHELIRSGPYAQVRHPIYTGMLTALFATALAIGNARAALGVAVLAAGLIYKIGVEERFMAEQFGEAYAQYRREVPALVPFVV
jgi:protein-S-isoprenylcysteine O-methyltransferase Ste14